MLISSIQVFLLSLFFLFLLGGTVLFICFQESGLSFQTHRDYIKELMVRKADSRVAYLLGLCTPTFYSFFFFNINLFIYLFIFGCFWFFVAVCGFLKLRRAGATLRCSVWASHCSGFCCCGARALGARASVVVARGLGSCGTRG